MSSLVLSVFPGIDLLGRAFEEEGYCVVRGPDLLWGGDIRTFHPPTGVFEGVIGGPPCQAFSRLKSLNPLAGSRHGNLIPEFRRIVVEAFPVWWVMENVPTAPSPEIRPPYSWTAITLKDRWVGGLQNRERRFTIGARNHIDPLAITSAVEVVALERPDAGGAVVLAGHGPVKHGEKWEGMPPIEESCELMGLPRDFTKEMPFTIQGKRSVIGNGVPMAMGRAIAKAVRRTTNGGDVT